MKMTIHKKPHIKEIKNYNQTLEYIIMKTI
jgi:hypothetical protein